MVKRDNTEAKGTIIMSAGRDILQVFNILKYRKFSGYSGLAAKNSIYQFLTNIILKGGSLLFTLIFARLLMPELFGLYSLALATIILFALLADLGIGQSLIVFISKSMQKNKPEEAKAYFNYIFKIKIWLTLLSVTLLVLSSKLIVSFYNDKPILLALLVGTLYVVSLSLIGVFDALFQAVNNFRQNMLRELIFQILRLIIVPIGALLFIKSSYDFILFVIIGLLSLTYIVALIFMAYVAYQKVPLMKEKSRGLNSLEKKKVNKFLGIMALTVLSGMFIGYIDTLMLGRFVTPEYIGFYQAALNAINSLIPLIPISIVLFPIFNRLKGKKLEVGFKKSAKITFIISVCLFVLTFIFAPLIIKIIYGSAYANSVLILRFLSFIVLIYQLSALYDGYLISRGKNKIVAKFLIITTIIGAILSYALIKIFVLQSFYMATIGAAIAVVATRAFYLATQIWNKSRLQ